MSLKMIDRRRAIVGSIIGTAVADSLGLPYEGLSPRRAAHLLGEPNRHRFFFGRGMFSDDTEHTYMVAQSLMVAGSDLELFSKDLSRRFRYWLLRLPAGIGKATARSILKMWLGFRPPRSGVFSAGNGPAMRSAILGVAIEDMKEMVRLVSVSSTITHTDPRATNGAIAVALAAHMAAREGAVNPISFATVLSEVLRDRDASEFFQLVDRLTASHARQETTAQFAQSLHLHRGVTGYVYHTVPVALHAWLRNPLDYQSAMQSVIACGGDADTTAAIVGGIVGSAVGKEGIPLEWLSGVCDWPCSIAWLERLGEALAEADEQPQCVVPGIAGYKVIPRNLLFLLIVLTHGLRRLLPPY